MRTFFYVMRYFVMVPVVPRFFMGGFALSIVVATATVGLGLATPARALAPLLLLHLFAVSSGFVVPARRGHYDLVLTIGQSRSRVAALHCVLSSAPGLASWCIAGVLEGLSGTDPDRLTFATGTWAAFLTISSIGWATTVPLPRLTGAIAWLFVMVATSVVAPEVWVASSGDPATQRLLGPIATILCPFVMIGRKLWGADLLVVIPALALGAGAVLAACIWVERSDVPLEAAQ